MPHYLYLHGFNSGPGSAKATETQTFLCALGREHRFHCPALSPYPATALQQAQALVARLPADTVLIGSSLGGFYATWLAETCQRKAVLINPAVRPFLRREVLLQEQHNPYSGERYQLTEADLAVLQRHFIARPTPQRYWLVLGSADETLDWREAAQHYAGCRQTIFAGDDHRLQRWHECLPALAAFAAGAGGF